MAQAFTNSISWPRTHMEVDAAGEAMYLSALAHLVLGTPLEHDLAAAVNAWFAAQPPTIRDDEDRARRLHELLGELDALRDE